VLKLGQLLGSLKGWIYLLTSLLPAAWTFTAGLFEGRPVSEIVPFVTLAFGSGAMLGSGLVRGYEVVSGWYGLQKEATRLANDFQALVDVGQKDMLISHAAELWAGRDANAYQKLVCLRRIKQAADQGLIAFTGAAGGRASKDSMASLPDLVKFFTEKRFATLPPLPPQPPSRIRPVKSIERSNWVNSWKR
jgi:hypothetical protein